MGTIDSAGNMHRPAGSPDGGKFTSRSNPAPNLALTEPDEQLVWVVVGDDHEARLVEATSADDALETARSMFTADYDEDYGIDLLTVAGAFRGDIDDPEQLEFVPHDSLDDERSARRALHLAD